MCILRFRARTPHPMCLRANRRVNGYGRAGSLPATQRTLRQIALSTERRLEIGRSVPSSMLPQFSYIVDLLGAPLRHDMP